MPAVARAAAEDPPLIGIPPIRATLPTIMGTLSRYRISTVPLRITHTSELREAVGSEALALTVERERPPAMSNNVKAAVFRVAFQ